MPNGNPADEIQMRAALDFVEAAALVIERGTAEAHGEPRVPVYNQFAQDLFGPPPGPGEFPAWERACGFYSADGKSKRPHERCRVEDLPWNRALRGEVVKHALYFLRNDRCRAGAWIQASARVNVDQSPVDESAGLARITVSIRDISARRRAEHAMRAARRLSRALFEESQAAVIRSTMDGRILAVNKAFARMVGYERPDEVCIQRASQLHIPGAREPLIAELTRKGSLSEYPIEFRRKDGSRGWAVASIHMVEPEPDEFEWSIVSTLVDITAHRRAEAARMQSEKRFAEFMRYLPGVAFIKDRFGRYVFFSESSLRTMDLDADKVIGKMDDEIWPPEIAARFQQSDQEVITQGRAIRVAEDVPLESGMHRWVVYKFPIPNEAGELTLIGGVGVDETERWNVETRTSEAEKMEAIGRLAAGVAHDFNNLLTVISGYGQMLADAVAREAPVERLAVYVDELLAASKRATNLTDQLLAFGRKQAARRIRMDLRARVAETERMLRRVIGEHIELAVEASAEPCFVRADPVQMEQVIMNLAVNGRDAMPRGGRLVIRVIPASELPAGLEGPGFVLLEVSDTGVGIDAATRPRIFEPFFTSKPEGKGTGLGLSTVYGIVKQNGGEITVTSEPGAGTTFQVFLPACNEAAAPVAVKSVGSVAQGAGRGNETILLVEDDDTVRGLVKVMLEKYGYKPIVADCGKEALRIFRERGAEIQLLLTDVIMPQMSGRELAVTLRRFAPSLKILYMSGYTAEEIATQGLVNSAPVLLRKPFSAETLALRVREVLDTAVHAC